MRKISFVVLISLLFIKCTNSTSNQNIGQKNNSNICNFNGNAIIFFNKELNTDRVYLYQIRNLDSISFLNYSPNAFLDSLTCIQIIFGLDNLMRLDSNKKGILTKKNKCLPNDSMCFSKVLVKYTNYAIVKLTNIDSTIESDCKMDLITATDSSTLDIFHFYK